jgi:YD repeat-containing protein
MEVSARERIAAESGMIRDIAQWHAEARTQCMPWTPTTHHFATREFWPMGECQTVSSSFEERLERLEHENRSLRRKVWALLWGGPAIAAGALLLGATQNREGSFTTLVAEQIVVNDSKGARRVVIGTLPDGRAGISMFADDQERITFGTGPEGSATVTYRDREGKVREINGTGPDGTARLGLYDKNSTLRVSVETSSNGAAGVLIRDAKDQDRVVTVTSADGRASQQFYDPSHKLRIHTYTTNAGFSRQDTFDSKGHWRLAVGILPDGKAGVAVLDEKGMPLEELAR